LGFVRRLVGAKASVAVDAKDRVLRFGGMVGRELYQFYIDSTHQLQHRRFHMLVEQVFARLKPLAPIVPLQGAEELDHLLWETCKRSRHDTLPYNLTR